MSRILSAARLRRTSVANTGSVMITHCARHPAACQRQCNADSSGSNRSGVDGAMTICKDGPQLMIRKHSSSSAGDYSSCLKDTAGEFWNNKAGCWLVDRQSQ